MTLLIKMKIWLILLLLISACKTAKVYGPTLVELNAQQYKEVSLQQLLQNKGKYHGQFIKTEGFFHFGFEESAIYYDIDISLGDTSIKYRDYCGLWIEFNINDPYYFSYPDSLKNKLVMVKGYFDTTRTGHVAGCYRAELTNANNLRIVR